MKGFAPGKKFLIIVTRSFTHEAQNALLKVFEEPASDTHFVVIMPDASVLLPTLRSRLHFIQNKKQETRNFEQNAGKFLRGDVVLRMSMIKKMVEDKDKAAAERFVGDLERALYEKFSQARSSQLAAALAEIERYRNYLSGRAPSVKMILEHLALALPWA
jgi:hypothetical protein